jgi:hypothetical protein
MTKAKAIEVLRWMVDGFMELDENDNVRAVSENFVTAATQLADSVVSDDEGQVFRDFIEPIGDGTFYIPNDPDTVKEVEKWFARMGS